MGRIKKIFTLNGRLSIGMRTAKTGLSAFLAIALSYTPLVSTPFYAALGAVFGMQSTVSQSVRLGRGRIVGTLIGAFIGFIFASFNLTAAPFAALAIILIIIIARTLKLTCSIVIMFALALSIMLNPRDQGLVIYTLLRTLDTGLGVAIGVLVNYFIAPPDYTEDLFDEINKINELTTLVLKDPDKLPILSKELSRLQTLHHNYTIDEKYDPDYKASRTLSTTVEACNDLYFHLKNIQHDDQAIKDYHREQVKETLELLEESIEELEESIE